APAVGLGLGGGRAAGLAKRLMLPVSNDTLLRVVRRRSCPPADRLAVVGIDDWAWRRNHRYASIICNLERRRVVTLLPDRERATAEAWFAAHPTITVVARDRGGGYGEAAARALPHAGQVADRWHLMECQPGLSRRCPQIDAPDTQRHRCDNDQSRAADSRGAPPV